MANSSAQAAKGRDGSGGSGKPPERPTTKHAQAAVYSQSSHARAYEYALAYAHARAFVSLAVKGSGLLALLLSTVVLLGGFVSSLGKEDFLCITVITAIQAAGIFKDWERSLEYLASFLDTYILVMRRAMRLMVNSVWAHDSLGLFTGISLVVVVWSLSFVGFCAQVIYLLGPFACAAISSWRIAKLRNHGSNKDKDGGTDSMAGMVVAALNMFYSLVIFQGTLFGVLLFTLAIGDSVVASHLLEREQLREKWAQKCIRRYISDITARCRKNALSIKGRDLIKYGAELLDSESQKDYLYGARLLSAFVKKGEDVSWALLPSRHRIQRLIDSLMISSSPDDEPQYLSEFGRCFVVIGGLDDKKEIRELAATIVAHVAAHIDDLANYPGAMRCISSLFQDQQEQTTQTYRRRNSKQVPDDPHQRPIGPLTKRQHCRKEERMQTLIREEERQHIKLMRDQKRMKIREHRHRNKREGGTSNQLVQQGLTILQRLASNRDDNRRIICSTPGLLPKITAPLYCETLIQDVAKTKVWADMVTRCLKVLYQLIRAPGRPSKRMRHHIFSKPQTLSNLKSILLELGNNNEAHHQELQVVTMMILTELALDLSINLTDEIKKVLVTKQLKTFLLANGDGAAVAGRTLVSLSTNSASNSALIKITQDDIIDRLTEILDGDDNKNIMQIRTIATEIMANLCAHCNVGNMKEILPKVLKKFMSVKIKSQERKASADQNNIVLGDEENQGNPVSTQGDHTEIEEISDQEKEEQEAFLSLAQVICDKLSSADLDGAIQRAVDQTNAGSEEQRREAFVDKLKTIIDGNCHPGADSLRIVKLCSQIAISVMRCEQYVEIFRNKGFKSSLSEASKTMSELESCMLFVGTDFGPKKTVRPLFYEIEKTWSEM